MFAGLAKTYTKEVDNINRAIAQCAVPTPALDTTPRAPAFIIKAKEGLKPKILGDDTNPVELEPWLKRFRAFYANSQMHQAEIEEQRTYLDCRVRTEMDRVRTEMDRLARTNLPIYTADKTVRTAITVLREIFESKHPIRKRQKSLFKTVQSKGENIQSFYEMYMRLANTAELEKINYEDFLANLFHHHSLRP